MASINTSKLLLAGAAAFAVLYVADGLVNGVLLADQWTAYQKSIGKTGEFSAAQLGIFAVLDFSALTPKLRQLDPLTRPCPPCPQSHSFSRSYGTILPTSLIYFILVGQRLLTLET